MKCHLLDYFEETVRKKAEDIAVRHNDQEICFQTLKDKAQKLGTRSIRPLPYSFPRRSAP